MLCNCTGLWRRHLLADDAAEEQGTTPATVDHFPGVNCTPPAIKEFPRPLIPQYVREKGGLVVHLIIAAYMFLGLSIVCDDYFVPALERMVECTYQLRYLTCFAFELHCILHRLLRQGILHQGIR